MPGYMKNRVIWLSAFLITHYESILSTVSSSAGCSVFLSNHASRKQSCPATRSLREDQALLLRRHLPLVPRAASPHGGNLVAEPLTRYLYCSTLLPAVWSLRRWAGATTEICPAEGGFSRISCIFLILVDSIIEIITEKGWLLSKFWVLLLTGVDWRT